MDATKIDPSEIKDVVKNDESNNEVYEYYDEEYSGSDFQMMKKKLILSRLSRRLLDSL